MSFWDKGDQTTPLIYAWMVSRQKTMVGVVGPSGRRMLVWWIIGVEVGACEQRVPIRCAVRACGVARFAV